MSVDIFLCFFSLNKFMSISTKKSDRYFKLCCICNFIRVYSLSVVEPPPAVKMVNGTQQL